MKRNLAAITTVNGKMEEKMVMEYINFPKNTSTKETLSFQYLKE